MDHHEVSSTLYSAAYYIKLQDAYASEANLVGSWKLIGYVSPGSTSAGSAGSTTNFAYTAGETIAVNAETGTAIQGFGAITWQAASRVALNDCAPQSAWTVTTNAADNGNSLTYAADSPCDDLTPSFEKIGK